jgi:hypothetical protein
MKWIYFRSWSIEYNYPFKSTVFPAMYSPNFCAECGERLTRKGWRALIRARHCDDCSRRLGKSDLVKGIATISIVAVSGFVVGRHLRPAAPPLVIQRAANSPLSDMPVNLNDSARVASQRDSTRPNADALNPLPANDKAYICGARTKKGTPCHRRVHAAGERCFQHKGMSSLLPLSKLVVRP